MPSHLYVAASDPQNFFDPDRIIVHRAACWAWLFSGSFQTSLAKLPAHEKPWFFSAPVHMSGHDFPSPEWFDVHNRTLARLEYECYSSFYKPLYDGIGLPNTLVDIGMEYPVIVFQPQSTDFRIAYHARHIWDSAHFPANMTWEHFLDIAADQLYTQYGGGHIGYSTPYWIPPELVRTRESVYWYYGPTLVPYIIAGWKSVGLTSMYSGPYQASCKAVEDYTRKALGTGKVEDYRNVPSRADGLYSSSYSLRLAGVKHIEDNEEKYSYAEGDDEDNEDYEEYDYDEDYEEEPDYAW